MSEEKQSIAALESRINFLESQISSAPVASEYWDWQSVLAERGETFSEGLDTSLFGIIIDNANERVQVLTRRATLHRYGDTPLHWTAADKYLTYADMGAAGDHLITMELDPDVASTATFEIYDSEEVDPKPVRARLYTVTLTQVDAGPPVVYSAVLKRVWRPGDVDIVPLWGDHAIEEP